MILLGIGISGGGLYYLLRDHLIRHLEQIAKASADYSDESKRKIISISHHILSMYKTYLPSTQGDGPRFSSLLEF